jgi:bacillithiol biosynthesis cysteine-adding enzyme BshC
MPGPFSPSFLAGDARAEQLLPAHFRNESARARQLQQARERRASRALLDALGEQDRKWPPSPARRRNLEALAQPGTTAVVTGQQVALFLGPLYSFYKAASAIAVARALERESGTRCVPVFWLQTEDHDFDEINHCHVLTPEGEVLRLEVGEESGGPGASRVSVRHRLLGPGVTAALRQLEASLGRLPGAGEFLELLGAHYRPEATLSDAFAGVMAALFAEEGLILLDPRDPAIAKLAAPIHRLAITSAGPVADLLLQRARSLEGAGFEAQVHVRPGSPLSFFHPERPEGPRYRLAPHGADWALVGREEVLSHAELLRTLEQEPLRFSSSALLRPILQDSLLPTVAYVGGPGEINYLAQLPPLYGLFGLTPPMIIPRARFRLLEPRTRSLLETLGLRPQEIERAPEELARALAATSPADHPAPEALRERLLAEVGRILGELEAPARSLNVLDAVRRTRGTIEHAVSRLVGRYGRALLERDRVTADRLARLRRSLFPDGVPQERFHSLPYFACKVGHEALKQAVLANLEPFAAELRDLPL